MKFKEETFLRQKESLAALATDFRCILGDLSPVEFVTLEKHVSKLRVALAPAWERLNWNSLIIDEYLLRAHKAMGKFSALFDVLRKTTQILECVLDTFSSADLFCLEGRVFADVSKAHSQQTFVSNLRSCKVKFNRTFAHSSFACFLLLTSPSRWLRIIENYKEYILITRTFFTYSECAVMSNSVVIRLNLRLVGLLIVTFSPGKLVQLV